MIRIDLINNFIKMFFISLYTYFVYIKITECKNNSTFNKIFIVIESIIISVLYVALIQYFHPVGIIIVLYFIDGIVISYILKNEINYSIIVTIISFIITYSTYLVSVIISAMILAFWNPYIDRNDFMILVTVLILTSLLLGILLKIKRLKKGINFIKNANISKNIINVVMLFTAVTIILFGLLQKDNSKVLNTYLLIGSVLIFVIFIIWIKTQITKTYKSKMRDRTIEIQKTEIDEQTKLIEEIKAENLKLATAVHKYNSKFESLEHAMKRALSLDSKTEFANEISVILKESEETLKNFAKEVEVNTNKLPLTNIAGIDKMFKYIQEEAVKDNINFDLKINESINPLIENIIQKEKFEILIGDHLKDAIIAIKASEATYKSILVTLGLVEGIYEFSVYDTGIEFEIDTLLKLGEEQVTTHKNEGGSGIGFMTTFETLKECKASLVIEEYSPETTNYTKSVTIKFDGKNEYKICSYRAEKIKEQKSKRRIIIEKIK